MKFIIQLWFIVMGSADRRLLGARTGSFGGFETGQNTLTLVSSNPCQCQENQRDFPESARGF